MTHKGRALMDLTGKRVGNLSVLHVSRKVKIPNHKTTTLVWWLCRCDCGVEKEFRSSNLLGSRRSRPTQSCGCKKWERVAKANTTHGNACSKMNGRPCTDEYRAWAKMKERCLNKRDKSYPRYGGRGITVAVEWVDDFDRFLADMGKRPSKDYSLDRIDNNRGYGPDNCRWSTRIEQANNKANNVVITHGDVTATMSQWARQLGCKPGSIGARLSRGWSPQRAVSEPFKETES